MKKKVSILFGVILALVFAFALTACGKVSLKLTFKVDGVDYATISTSGDEVIKMPENPTKDGFVFDGWFWDEGTWQRPFTANSLLDTPLSSDMSVYAKFTATEDVSHVHEYLVKNVSSEYLATPATCTEKAKYYYSCSCGEKGTETFESGETLRCNAIYHWGTNGVKEKHTMVRDVCAVCKKEATSVDKFTFTKIDGGYEITGYDGNDLDIILPSEYNGLPIVAIGDSIFLDVTVAETYGVIKSVYISENITKIGMSFIGCIGIREVYIPHSVKDVSVDAFYVCLVTEIFNDSELDLQIGSEENGKIAEFAENIITSANESKVSQNDDGYILYNDGEEVVLVGYRGDSGNLIVPSNVSKIWPGAFAGDNNIKDVKINKNVTNVGMAAFKMCANIESVTFDADVAKIENGTFEQCPKLMQIKISDSITSIGDWVFSDCRSLTNVTIPKNVTEIGEKAFYNCSSLTSVTIPNGVTSIKNNTFYNCSSLTNVTIPDSVTSIGEYAFHGCTKLITIYYKGTEQNWSELGIDNGNACLKSATKYYYSENEPTDSIADTSELRSLAAKYGNVFIENARRFFIGTESYFTVKYDCVVLERDETLANIEPYIFDPALDKDKIVAGVFVKAVITTIATGEVQTCYYNYGIMLSELQSEDYTVSHSQSPDGQWLLRRIELNSNIIMETDLDPSLSKVSYWHYVNDEPTAWKK